MSTGVVASVDATSRPFTAAVSHTPYSPQRLYRGDNLLDPLGIVLLREHGLGVGRRCNATLLRVDSLLRAFVLFGDRVVDPNDCAMRRVAVEVFIEVLQRSVRCFGVQKVDDRQKDKIQNGKDWKLSAS